MEPGKVWEMEWADMVRLYDYWNECPPVHELVAAYVGYKPPREAPIEASASEIAAFFNEMRRPFLGAEKHGVA